jgi:hypothetical protein
MPSNIKQTGEILGIILQKVEDPLDGKRAPIRTAKVAVT